MASMLQVVIYLWRGCEDVVCGEKGEPDGMVDLM